MKNIIKLLFLGISTASLVHAKEVPLSEVKINTLSARGLRTYIENLEANGDTIKATEAQRTTIKSKLNMNDYQLNQFLNISAPLPPAQQGPGSGMSGGTGTGMGEGAGTGETGMGGGTGSGAPEAPAAPGVPAAPFAPGAPIAPSAPSAPGIPGMPTPPSIGGETGTQKPVPTKKPVEDLTPEQLAALPDTAKIESDDVINAAINQIAQLALSEKYIGAMNKILQDALKSPAFKNKQVLRSSLVKDGSFDKFVAQLKDAQLSGELYDDLSNPESSKFIKLLIVLFQSYLLKPQALIIADPNVLLDILINMALSQRPIVARPEEGAQTNSDTRATKVLDENLIMLIKADPGFDQFLKDNAEAASKKLEKGQTAEPVVAVLAQDFLKLLLKNLKLLLIHPKFLKIADKDGRLAGKGTILAADGLLNYLQSEDPNAFNIRRVRGALQDQIYFDPAQLEEFFKENDNENAVKALLSDHASRLKSVVLSVQELLNKELAIVKTIKDLRNKLQLAAARAKFKNDADKKQVTDMLKNLETKPDPKVIGDGLRALGVELSLIGGIKKMIGEESKKFETQAKVKIILEQIKEAAKKGKVDSLLLDQLKPSLTPYQLAALAGVERTIDSAYGILKALIGQATLIKIVSLQSFYNWIYEYGVLMLLFKNLQTEAKTMKPQDVLEKLKVSLNAMDTGDVQSNIPYFSVITDPRYNSIITAGLYKGKLQGIIENINNYDLAGLRNALKAFVTNAHTGVEDSAEFNDLVNSALELLRKAMFDELIRQLQVLNSGSGGFKIKGLELTGKEKGRNALIYDALKGIFNNEEKALRAGLDKLDVAAFKGNIPKLLKAINDKLNPQVNQALDRDLKKLTENEKKAIIALWENYLNSVADKLGQLQKASQPAMTAPTSSPETGVLTAPAAPGEIPTAPQAPSAPEAPAYAQTTAGTPTAPEAPLAPPL